MSLVTAERMIATTDFEVAGTQYVARRLPVMAVVNIGRRLAPVLLTFRSLLAGIAKQSKPANAPAPAGAEGAPAEAVEAPPENDPLQKFIPMVEAISKLSDDDVQHVFRECLLVTRAKANWGAGPLWDERGVSENLTAGEVLAIVGNVLGAAFGELMDDLPSLGVPGFAEMADKAA